MTTSNLTLPQTADQLRSAIKAAIAYYQGSPVKNDNKLNEALAASLGFDNYDQLSARLKAEESEITPYDIDFDYNGDQQIIINGVRIDTSLTHEEIVAYTVASREDRISGIRSWIAEAQRDPSRHHDVYLMQKDLDTLLASNDEYVLEAMGTNGFVAGDVDPVEFNQICNEMLTQAAEYYQDLVGEPTKTGTCYTDLYTYYGNDDVDQVYAGELVLIQEAFLSDDKLPLGMAVSKFSGHVPEGYIAAYAGSNGEYVPVEGFGEDTAS